MAAALITGTWDIKFEDYYFPIVIVENKDGSIEGEGWYGKYDQGVILRKARKTGTHFTIEGRREDDKVQWTQKYSEHNQNKIKDTLSPDGMTLEGEWFSVKNQKHGGKHIVKKRQLRAYRPIPASTNIRRSGIIKAAVGEVWATICDFNFKWNPRVLETLCEKPKTIDEETDLNYGDIVQTVCLRGIDEYERKIVWEVVKSDKPVQYSSARYSIHLEEITMSNRTLMICNCVFSNDANANAVADQGLKFHDYIEQVQKLVTVAYE